MESEQEFRNLRDDVIAKLRPKPGTQFQFCFGSIHNGAALFLLSRSALFTLHSSLFTLHSSLSTLHSSQAIPPQTLNFFSRKYIFYCRMMLEFRNKKYIYLLLRKTGPVLQ